MAIQLGWYLEDRVLYERYYHHVTIEELTRMSHQSHSLHHRAAAPMHTLIDLSDVKSFPTNLSRVQAAITLPTAIERGWMVVIIPEGNVLLQFVAAYAAQIRATNARYRMFRSLSTAVDFLNVTDPQLNLAHTASVRYLQALQPVV
ncbi:MAG: hypothetical protein U0670_18730 [Anaerolineae bacterium]